MYQHHVSHHLVSCLWKHKRLTGSANLNTISPHLKTVGSGIPGSAPRLKPANQNTDGFEHTGLYLRIFILRLKASSIEISWLISSTECSQSKTHFYKCSGSEPKMKQILSWLLGAFISHRSCLSVDYSDQRPLTSSDDVQISRLRNSVTEQRVTTSQRSERHFWLTACTLREKKIHFLLLHSANGRVDRDATLS